jgi:outer membrane biosynthesis protein TonB
MPYRAADGFSWQTADDAMRARRIMAALVLVAAGWAIGFFAGRMSAWVFPVTQPNTAALTAGLDKTPQRFAPNPLANAEPPPAPRVEEKQAAKQPEPPAAPAPPEQPQPNVNVLNNPASQQPGPQAGGDKRITVTPDEGDRVEAPQNNARVAETNAERAPDRRTIRPDDERRVDAMDDGRAFDAAGVAECESRYSSFRRSDGTYQPFGRSSRQVCPFLR